MWATMGDVPQGGDAPEEFVSLPMTIVLSEPSTHAQTFRHACRVQFTLLQSGAWSSLEQSELRTPSPVLMLQSWESLMWE